MLIVVRPYFEAVREERILKNIAENRIVTTQLMSPLLYYKNSQAFIPVPEVEVTRIKDISVSI
jgi:hypothetical protein